MSSEKIEKPTIKPLKSISKVWLIPFLAILIGLWMIYFHLSSQGPLIVINFETGEGIEATKTKIRIKNVEVGLVESIELNENLEGVAVTARIHKNNSSLLREDTEFWVVRPRIGKGGVSGLGTLLSGAYIELSAGFSDSEKLEFIGLESEPVTPMGTPGLHLTLSSSEHTTLQEGDPILFQGMNVGRIEYVHFNSQERMVYYNAFIQKPHDELITTNTKFWKINGFEITMSADGVRLETGTLETMITGGIAFDIPNDMPRGDVVTERQDFVIYPNKNAIYEKRYKYGLQYILLFKESIRGLRPGAPVEYRGIKLGSVTRTDVEYPEIVNVLNPDTLIPVMITIEPARMGFADKKAILDKVQITILELIRNGLRGGLATGNLLTGSKYIELQYAEGVHNEPRSFSNHPVIPTIEGQLDQVIKKFGKVMDKLYNLPFEPVLESADDMVKQASITLKEFRDTASQLTLLLEQSNQENFLGSMQEAIDSISNLLIDYSEGSLIHDEIQGVLQTMKGTLEELEPFLLQLNEKPNSLIFTNKKNSDNEPKGVQ